jgi:hypothetical protein
MAGVMITGVSLAALVTDPALDERSLTVVTAVYLAATDRQGAKVESVEAWAQETGYDVEATTMLDAIRCT